MTGAQHVKRLEELKSLRAPLETLWREAYDYTFPQRGEKLGQNILGDGALSAASARSKQARIYDGTAARAVQLLASMLLGGLTPANSRWAGLDIPNIEDDSDARKWLDGAAEVIWKNIHASDYDVAAFEAFNDMIISGMFVLFVEPGKEDSPYSFQQWPLHSVYCADSTGKGGVNTVYRSFALTAEQAVNEYGDKVSDEVKTAAEKKPDTRFEFVHAIYPRKKPKATELPIASEHIEVKKKNIVRKAGYHEMPVMVPRWFAIPDSVYSLGPVHVALPDIRSINEVVKLVLSNADLAIAGMWGAVDDGVLNPKAVTVGPRKIIPVANKDSIFPLTSGARFDVSALEIERLQRSIREKLMADQLQPQDGPAMTATEVHARVQLIRQQMGPMYGRLQSEFLQPLIKRCLGIAMRSGALATPPAEIQDRVSFVTYTSPLARAQKYEDVNAIDRLEANIAALAANVGMPQALDIYDVDKALRKKAVLLGVPAEVLRSEKEVKAIREDRAQAMQEQQAMAQAHELQTKAVPALLKGGKSAA